MNLFFVTELSHPFAFDWRIIGASEARREAIRVSRIFDHWTATRQASLHNRGGSMNKREYVRYDTRAFPGNMGEAAISWQGQSEIASAVANCSAHGIKVSIAHSLAPPDLPKKKDIVKVRMPIDDMWFTGRPMERGDWNSIYLIIGCF